MSTVDTIEHQISDSDFDHFTESLEKWSGIVISRSKKYLVAHRLEDLMAENGCQTLRQLVAKAGEIRHALLRKKIVDAMTTNETSWFRDVYPFDTLKRKLFRKYEELNGDAPIRIWSAACSTGQEPYGISISFQQYLSLESKHNSSGIEIIATDISPTALAAARMGVYDNLSMSRGCKASFREMYFTTDKNNVSTVRPEIKSFVNFKPLNLMDSYQSLGIFDVIFLRYVLIYFSDEAKKDIIHRISRRLKPGGALFLGSTESLVRHSDEFEMVKDGAGLYYQRKELLAG
ncbi:MAG TPA: chemotaxis protein [Gammaproteobacteria bacterium]|nr:chemotaxis protein [Gammaproteobacteria bacterium]